MASFDQAVKLYFKNYANFNGRASRSMYWWTVLFNALCGFVLGIVLGLLGVDSQVVDVCSGVLGLAFLLPSLSVAVRRLHDVGKGGGWIFIGLIPLVGSIWLLVLYLTPGDYDDNRFGSNPEYNP